MIILTYDIDLEKLLSLKDNAEDMLNYVRESVPDKYGYNESLISNQRYYYVTRVLKSKLNIEDKRAICKCLLQNIKTVGYMDCFITIKDIENFIDEDRFREIIRKGNRK